MLIKADAKLDVLVRFKAKLFKRLNVCGCRKDNRTMVWRVMEDCSWLVYLLLGKALYNTGENFASIMP